MLRPDQFSINEAWIVFKLNDAPIITGADGSFNLIALMDAASCFILSNTLVPANSSDLSTLEVKRLFKGTQAHKQRLPSTLYIPNDTPAQALTIEAKSKGISVVSLPTEQLLIFIGEARDGFIERFGGKSAH